MAQDVTVEFNFKLIGDLNEKLGRINKNLKKTNKIKLNKITSGFTKLKFNIIAMNQALELAGRIVRGVTGFFGGFINAAIKVEDLTTQFQTLTGSVENAAILIKDLQEFSAKTPFQLEGLAQASKSLLAFGTAQEDVLGRLKFLGDAAAATGSDISDLKNIWTGSGSW